MSGKGAGGRQWRWRCLSEAFQRLHAPVHALLPSPTPASPHSVGVGQPARRNVAQAETPRLDRPHQAGRPGKLDVGPPGLQGWVGWAGQHQPGAQRARCCKRAGGALPCMTGGHGLQHTAPRPLPAWKVTPWGVLHTRRCSPDHRTQTAVSRVASRDEKTVACAAPMYLQQMAGASSSNRGSSAAAAVVAAVAAAGGMQPQWRVLTQIAECG